MTRAELEAILDNNDNARKFLHVLSIMEGTADFQDPYRALGGTRGMMATSLADHPANIGGGGRWRYKTLDGKTPVSTANGRYQFIRSTWNDNARQLGLRDFSPRSQDLAALNIIANAGQLQNIVNGNWQPAVQRLGSIWASLPTADQGKTNQAKRSWQYLANAFATAGLDSKALGLQGKAIAGLNKGVATGGRDINGNPVQPLQAPQFNQPSQSRVSAFSLDVPDAQPVERPNPFGISPTSQSNGIGFDNSLQSQPNLYESLFRNPNESFWTSKGFWE